MGTTPISTLATSVTQRLEELGGNSIFWNLQTEIFSAIEEALCDLLLLVGRPNFLVNTPFTATPNTPWQVMPTGSLLITDIITSAGYPLWKTSLYSLDYIQAGNGPGWEQDTAVLPTSWAPVGFTKFILYPAPTTAITLNLTTIAYPTDDPWPYTGSETVPFHDEFFQAIEEYAAHYCRIKEMGAEFEASMELYYSYLKLAERLTQIQDRQDPVIFSKTMGGRTMVNPIQKR